MPFALRNMVLTSACRSKPERISSLVRFGTLWRGILFVVTGGVAVASFSGVGIRSCISPAAKLLIYSLAIALSLVLRILFRPYRPVLKRIAAGGDCAQDSAIKKTHSPVQG